MTKPSPTVKNSPTGSADACIPAVHRVEAHLARRFNQVCLGALAEVTEPADLSPMDFGVLASLDDAPGIDQRRLSERMGIDAVSIHKTVVRLEQLGLMDRQVELTDKRSRSLKLTARGLELRNGLRPAVQAAMDRITTCLSIEERQVLRDLLTRVIDSNRIYARPGNGRRTRKSTVSLADGGPQPAAGTQKSDAKG